MTASVTPGEVDLAALVEAATPLPWCVEDPMDALWIVEAGKQPWDWKVIAECRWPEEPGDLSRKKVMANAALIVAAVNALPQHLARQAEDAATIAGLRAERDALKAAKWDVQHTDTANTLVEMGMARDAAEAEVTALRERVAGLEGALADILPSKLCGESWHLNDAVTVSITVTFGKLARARAALTEGKPDAA